MMKEISCLFDDNNIKMNVESWDGRCNKVLVNMLSVSHLIYDKLK